MSRQRFIGWAKQLQTKTLYIFMCAVLGFNGLGLAVPMLIGRAAAATADDIVINEVAPATGSANKWVELYNTSSGSFTIDGFRLVRNGNTFDTVFPAGTIIAGHGYYIAESTSSSLPLNSDTKAIELWTGPTSTGTKVDSIDWGTLAAGTSYGRSSDGANTWQVFTAPTKGAANATATASLGAEEFVTVDGSYKGISVGFNAKDFSGVTAVTVDMTRSNGTHAVMHGTASLFSLIDSNAAPYQFTAPFVIQPGSYDPAFDAYWTTDATTWTAATVPTSVTVTATDANGNKDVTNTNFLQNDASHPAYTSLLPVPTATVTVTPSNTQGWVFNGDPTTATPYEFSTAEHSIGSGSLYLPPIGSNASDKFIASKILDVPTPDLSSVSYDFLVAGNGTRTSADQYYLNVYTKLAGSTAYYNCRFDYVPAMGSTSAFTPASFDQASMPVSVGDRANDNFTCPSTLAGMPADSTVSFITLNVGDTSANDTGLAGYLDKVVVSTAAAITTYDFEPESAPPANGKGGGDASAPKPGSNGGFVLGAVSGSSTGSITQSSASDGEVLSDSTPLPTTTTAPSEVKTDKNSKDSDTKNTKDTSDKASSCSKLLGLCWYWWIPIVLGVAAIVYWFIRSADTNNTTTSGR
jgi:hypothetical protein